MKRKKRNPLIATGLSGPSPEEIEWRAKSYRRADGITQCPAAFSNGYGWAVTMDARVQTVRPSRQMLGEEL